jgi:hypothetical protein
LLFAAYGICSPFSVSESEGIAGGHLNNAGDHQEGLDRVLWTIAKEDFIVALRQWNERRKKFG